MKIKKYFLLTVSLIIFGLTALTLLSSFNIIDPVKAEQQYQPGTLLKSNTSSAIYYINKDNKKYIFTDERTYYSWYDDFNNVMETTVSELDQYEDGGAVTIRPGTRLITHVNTNKVYAVEQNGRLRYIPSEDVAKSLYGDDWSSLVVDIPATLFTTTYTKGLELSNILPDGTIVKQKDTNGYYYIQDGQKRVFTTGEAFINNKFRFKDALELDISSYESGTSIQDKEDELVGYGEVVEKMTETTEESVNIIIEANNKFAVDLYSEYKSEEGNIFFSPYSISTALAMTYEGAKGQTAEEMQSVFYFPEDDSVRRSGYASLYNEINKGDKKYKLSTANALWAEQDYTFLDEYFDLINQYYDGKVTNLDFKTDLENSRITINNWVEDKTNDKIKDLIPSGLITSITRLVLTNAIYFKGEWVKQFNEEETQDRDFRISSNNNVKVKMMQRTDDESIWSYAENNQLQILEMPYSGEELSMLVLLPKDDDIESLENSITTEKLSEWKNNLEEQRVNIVIPRFKFETKYFMSDTLVKMGMLTAFSDVADFSGMTGKMDLNIDEVIHQAFVEVNEEGTEAAAATAVIMKPTTSIGLEEPIIPAFMADHPFIFVIQQKDSGNILFMGRVTNPAEQ